MPTLLSPAGLWALAALAVPLALHLWRRPPRTVRLGSLRYLERLSRNRPRDLRWHERLLLATRLLLLGFLALILARPHWRPGSLDRAQRWALLDPAAAPEGNALVRLHTLQTAGYETHLLAPGFPRRANVPFNGSPDLWSLLRELDAGLPAGSSLAVFTPGRLSSLRGERPALSRCRVEWVITPALAAAPPAVPDAISPSPSLTVLILHDAARADDSRYLAAAVRAVAQVTGRNIALTERAAGESDIPGTHFDWVFWLADRSPPASLAAQATNLLADAEETSPDRVDATPGWIVSQPDVAGAEALADPVRLWRRIPYPGISAGAVYWTDAFGHPLLTGSSDGTHRRWRFFSRFHPDWTDLPRTSAFPACLCAMLVPGSNAPLFADPIRDLRLADPAQLPAAAASLSTPAVSLPLPRQTPGLQGWCWLLAALLFGLERLLSRRRPSAALQKATPSADRVAPALAR